MDIEVPRRVQNTMQRRAYLRAAEKQLTAEKQPIAEKLCMVRPRVLHTGSSSSCLSSPVPNGPSLVSHAWLRGDPVETRSLRSSSSKKDITWIEDLRSGANSGISTQAIPEHRKDQRRRDNLRKLYLLYWLFGLIFFYWNQESQSLDWSFYLSISCTTILVQLFADFVSLIHNLGLPDFPIGTRQNLGYPGQSVFSPF